MSLLKQGVTYGAVGVLQIFIDWLCFVGLTWFGVQAEIANVLGRVLGALLGFWLNGRLTFRRQTDELGGLSRKQFLRFGASWLLMTLLSTIGIHFITRFGGLSWAWLLKPVQDVALAAFGFTVSKYWIYRK